MIQGGNAGLHGVMGGTIELSATVSATEASSPEPDCHSHVAASPESPESPVAGLPQGPCNDGACAICLCAVPPSAAMTTLVWQSAPALAAALNGYLIEVDTPKPPEPLLRPPIA